MIEHWPQASVPAEIEAQVLAITEAEWPTDGGPRIPRHDVLLDPVTVVNLVDGRVVAALSILSTTITHRGETYWASGLSAVVTSSALRGHGYGLELVSAAHSLIRSWKVDLSLFTCDEDLVSFYERAGWRRASGGLIGGTREKPVRSLELGKVMVLDPWLPQLQGDELELYPGDIDKLW